MSSAKFASITAGLLARKGEAMPWAQGGTQENEKPMPAWRQPAAPPVPPMVMPRAPVLAAALPPSTPLPPKDRSCSIRMSAHDYERLGIIAVKTGVSRPQLLKDALAQFLAARAKQHGCLCLKAGVEACNADCGG
jgi:predicted transcriptional regulator